MRWFDDYSRIQANRDAYFESENNPKQLGRYPLVDKTLLFVSPDAREVHIQGKYDHQFVNEELKFIEFEGRYLNSLKDLKSIYEYELLPSYPELRQLPSPGSRVRLPKRVTLGAAGQQYEPHYLMQRIENAHRNPEKLMDDDLVLAYFVDQIFELGRTGLLSNYFNPLPNINDISEQFAGRLAAKDSQYPQFFSFTKVKLGEIEKRVKRGFAQLGELDRCRDTRDAEIFIRELSDDQLLELYLVEHVLQAYCNHPISEFGFVHWEYNQRISSRQG